MRVQALLSKTWTHWDTETNEPCIIDVFPDDVNVKDVTKFDVYATFRKKRPEKGKSFLVQKGRKIDMHDLPVWDDVKDRFLDLKTNPRAQQLAEDFEKKFLQIHKHKKLVQPAVSQPPSSNAAVKKLEAVGYSFRVKVENKHGQIPKNDSQPLGDVINAYNPEMWTSGNTVWMLVEVYYRDSKKPVASASLQGFPTVYGKKVATHKVWTDAKHRNQGIGTAIFLYVKDVTGYDVEASKVKTPHGQALWHKFSRTTGFCVQDIGIGQTLRVTKMTSDFVPTIL